MTECLNLRGGWIWSFQHGNHVNAFAFPCFSLLAVLLLHYLRLYLDLIAPPSLSSLMTASRADRQIYLHWWREGKREEKVISEGPGCPAAQTRAGGAWSELRPCGSSPSRAYLSMCCPWASEFSVGWDQSLTRLTQSHISLSGGNRKQKTGSAANAHAGCWTDIPQSQWFIFPQHHFSAGALDESGSCISSPSRADQEGSKSTPQNRMTSSGIS